MFQVERICYYPFFPQRPFLKSTICIEVHHLALHSFTFYFLCWPQVLTKPVLFSFSCKHAWLTDVCLWSSPLQCYYIDYLQLTFLSKSHKGEDWIVRNIVDPEWLGKWSNLEQLCFKRRHRPILSALSIHTQALLAESTLCSSFSVVKRCCIRCCHPSSSKKAKRIYGKESNNSWGERDSRRKD